MRIPASWCSGGAQNRVPTALIAEGNRTWLARVGRDKVGFDSGVSE